MAKRARLDTLRSIAYGSISGTYAAIGSTLTYPTRIVCLTNGTDADMLVSTDNTVSAGQMVLLKGTFKLYDLTANMVPGKDDNMELAVGTQFYVKQLAAPSSGSVYLECVYVT